MLAELRKTGLVRLGTVSWIEEFTDYLATCERHPGHVKARPREGISCNSMADVMAAPRFLEYAKTFTPLVTEYFGEPAHLWSLNAFYPGPDTPYIPSIHGMHVDREAGKILCLFMFGTDVGITGSQIMATGFSGMECVEGPRGTVWLADTTKWHCGLHNPVHRMLAWARWANEIPAAKAREGLPDIP